MNAFVVGMGAYLPPRTVANAEIAPLLEVDAAWIEASSGIRERRWVESETASDLAARAVAAALEDARIEPGRVDHLLAFTLSPDYVVPGIAPLVQRKVAGLGEVPCVDVRSACTAVLYALQLGTALLRSGAARTVVCVAAEAQSRGLDLSRPSAEISMLFGDGAGALVLRDEHAPGALEVLDVTIATDGRFAESLCVRDSLPSMDGRTVILHAVRKMVTAATELLARNGMTVGDVDLVVPHQANGNLAKALAERLGIARDRVFVNLDRYGNTSGAAAFIALEEARKTVRLPPGATLLIPAFGAGFSWGAALCRGV